MDCGKLERLYDEAEKADIGVYFRNMAETLKGYSTYAGGCYDIFINDSLDESGILRTMAHEMGHVGGNMCFDWTGDFLRELRERRAENSAVSYIVPYEDFVKVLKDGYLRNEYEAAEELKVGYELFMFAARYYASRGLPTRRCELISDWRQWDY